MSSTRSRSRSRWCNALAAASAAALVACGDAREGEPAPAATSTPEPTASGSDVTPSGPAVEPSSGAVDMPQPMPIASGASGDSGAGNGLGAGQGGTMSAPEPTQPMPTASEPAPEDLPPITLWIAGDSTVANGQTPCPRGWGGVFAPHFDERVRVRNSAVGGRSVHTWLYNVLPTLDEGTGECGLTRGADGEPVLQARWVDMLTGMQPGDYLFIQFGINDGDPSCDRHVGIEAFKTAYGMMANAAKERGAHPIFLTPVSSIACNGTQARGSRGGFVPATAEAGATFDVPVIDLHARSVALYQSLAFCPVAGGDVSASTTGPVGEFFCDDHTHFSSSGAAQIAELVAQALREQDIPLAAYLR